MPNLMMEREFPELSAICRAIELGVDQRVTVRQVDYLCHIADLIDMKDPDDDGWVEISQKEIASYIGVHGSGVVSPNINKLVDSGMLERKLRERSGRYAGKTPDSYRLPRE